MDVTSTLEVAISAALRRAAAEASSVFTPPTNSRAYGCSVKGCGRSAYAKGYCNAHYLRVRKGGSLEAPLRARKRDGLCADCGSASGSKGGWGLCQRHYRARRYAIVKDAVVAHLGGRCERCKQIYPRAVFDIHHRGGKTESPSSMLLNRSARAIAEELVQCSLLCANCHRLEHHDESLSPLRPEGA